MRAALFLVLLWTGCTRLTGYCESNADCAAGQVCGAGDRCHPGPPIPGDMAGGDMMSAIDMSPPDPAYRASWRFGGPGDDNGSTISVDAAGNLFLTGQCGDGADFGGGRRPGPGPLNLFVVKYSAAGAHLWSRVYGAAGASVTPIGAAVDAAGNLAVTGEFDHAVDLGQGMVTPSGSTDGFLALYDQHDGHALWVQTWGGPGVATDSAGVALASDGTLVVAGSFTGTISIGSDMLTSDVGREAYLARFTPDGQVQWTRRIGGNGDTTADGVAVDKGGDLFLAGTFTGATNLGGSQLVSAGRSDVFLASYAGSNATHRWSKRFGGPGDDMALGLALDEGGGVALTGTLTGMVDLGGGLRGGPSAGAAFLARYTGAGDPSWSLAFGSKQGYLTRPAAVVAAAGGAAVVGFFQDTVDFGGSAVSARGSTDAFVARYGDKGGLAGVRGYGWSQASDGASAVARTPAGELVVTGAFHDQLGLGGPALTSSGGADGFVLRLAL